MQFALGIILGALFFALGCGSFDRLVSLPEESTKQEVAEEAPISPEDARQQLADLGIPYSGRALYDYAAMGDTEVVRLFIAAGINVNYNNPHSDNDTPLMVASGAGHIDMVRMLVDAGASIYALNDADQTALMFASYYGRLEVVEYLLEQKAYRQETGIFLSMRNWKRPYSSMSFAAYGGHTDILDALVPACNELAKRDFRTNCHASMYRALVWAAHAGHVHVAKYIMEDPYKYSADVLRTGQMTPLIFAAYQGHTSMVQYLLDMGADIHYYLPRWIEKETPYGTMYEREYLYNAAMIASAYGHTEVALLILRHWMLQEGADAADQFGRTILMFATEVGDMDMVNMLIDNGAYVDAQTNAGTTALMFAAARGHLDVVQFLVDNGATIELENDYGHTAIQLAEANGHADIVELLGKGA